MLNHVYSLLMNDWRRDSPLLCQPPVANDYQRRRLSGQVRDLYLAVFGSDSDYLGRSVLLWRLLPILHSRDVVPYTLASDPRVTYDLLEHSPFVFAEFDKLQTSKVLCLSDSSETGTLAGSHYADESGRGLLLYSVTELTSGEFVKELLSGENHYGITEDVPGSSDVVTLNLPGGNYSLQIPRRGVETRWRVEAKTLPKLSAVDIGLRVRKSARSAAHALSATLRPELKPVTDWLSDLAPAELQLAAALLILSEAIYNSPKAT